MTGSGTRGLVFDIQGFSVHDGPGCRTLVFLSGCPLRCAWCANPEGLLPRPRLMVHAARCRGRTFRCVAACPHGAVARNPDPGPPVLFQRERCDRCATFECVAACRSRALSVAGASTTVGELMALLERDRRFWGDGGGVTFGGGEPFHQHVFLLEALRACRHRLIHTAVETSGHVDPDLLMEALPLVDTLLVDLKHMEPEAHRRGTGVDNDLVLENLERVASAARPGQLVVRVPLVPGFNDDDDNLRATAARLVRLGRPTVQLVPFHRLGASKYEQLGLPSPYADVAPPPPEQLARCAAVLLAAGLDCSDAAGDRWGG